MKRNKLKTFNVSQSLTVVILIGIVVALLFSVTLSALTTNFLLNGNLREELLHVTIFAVRTISIFIGALIGGLIYKKEYLIQIGITSLGYLLVLLGTGIILYDGSIRNFLSGAASVLIGSVLALVILNGTNVKRHTMPKFTN